MKNPKNILVFFILIAVLFWNPISFYIFYSNSDIYISSILKLLFWILPIIGICFMLVIRKTDLLTKVQNWVFGISFLGIFFGILVLINSLLGFIIQKNDSSKTSNLNKNKGLIFEPNTLAKYSSIEFNYKAHINSLGLRNKEISAEKGKGIYRILCFGDSWTFGWGVDVENSWPMQLENFLHSLGYSNIEVINCGQGGQFTSTYKKHMSQALPLLKPDLVLVGILQLDDLAQLFETNFILKNNDKPSIFDNIKHITKALIKASFCNYIALINKGKKEQIIAIKENWQASSTNQIQGFSKIQKLRFHSLPDTVKALFRTGNLNPGLLNYYINFPDREAIFNNPDNPATVFAFNEMNNDIKEMKRICEENKTKLIFINLPTNDFTGHRVVKNSADILQPFFMKNNKIDSLYQHIAFKNGIQYMQLTERFIELDDKNDYFFKFDGHPNKKGYEEIAKYIGTQLINNNLKIN